MASFDEWMAGADKLIKGTSVTSDTVEITQANARARPTAKEVAAGQIATPDAKSLPAAKPPMMPQDLDPANRLLWDLADSDGKRRMLESGAFSRDLASGKLDTQDYGKAGTGESLRKGNEAIQSLKTAAGGMAAGGAAASAVRSALPEAAGVLGNVVKSAVVGGTGAGSGQVVQDTLDPGVSAGDMPGRALDATKRGAIMGSIFAAANALLKPLADKITGGVAPRTQGDLFDKSKPQLTQEQVDSTLKRVGDAGTKVAAVTGLASGSIPAAVAAKGAARLLAEYAVALSNGTATQSMIDAALQAGIPLATIQGLSKSKHLVKTGDE